PVAPAAAHPPGRNRREDHRPVVLSIGSLVVDPPVVLAPMAGVTNTAFRRLCRTYGAGLYVSEMITARALVEGNERTMRMVRFADDERAAAVSLHARTAEQLYAGDARWDAVTALKDAVRTIPVLGNGDIWEADDALRMMASTGCDGVVVGRGCLGRPWLFRDLAA